MDADSNIVVTVGILDVQRGSIINLPLETLCERLDFNHLQIEGSIYPQDFGFGEYYCPESEYYAVYVFHKQTKLLVACSEASKVSNLSTESDDVFEMVSATAEPLRNFGISTQLAQNMLVLMKKINKSNPKRVFLIAEVLPEFKSKVEKILGRVGMSRSKRLREENPIYEIEICSEH